MPVLTLLPINNTPVASLWQPVQRYPCCPARSSSLVVLHQWRLLFCFPSPTPWKLSRLLLILHRRPLSPPGASCSASSRSWPWRALLGSTVGSYRRLLLGSTVGFCRRLLLGSTVGFYWDRPSALAGIDRRLLLGSTASCKVSSTNGNCTRRFGAAE
jgi:hypothetical protein